jgi:hypothetical protein
MAGRATTFTQGITDYNKWKQEQTVWVQFVKDGGLLADVPAFHRRDEVCFYASMNPNLASDATEAAHEKWKKEILPYIPTDVLFMGYITGNIGYKISAEEDEAERQREERTKQLRQPQQKPLPLYRSYALL